MLRMRSIQCLFGKQEMLKKFIYIYLLAIANLSLATENKIVAKVNGKAIYEEEIKSTMKLYSNMNPDNLGEAEFNFDKIDSESKKEIVRSLIIGELMLSEAKKSKIEQSSEYKEALELASKQLVQKLFIEKMVKDNITEAKVKEKYQELSKLQSDKDEYKACHILVKTEEEAKEIKKKLDKGEDFSKLAKEYSLDENKDSGGSLGYFSNGQMVQNFENATASLKIGQISSPVQTEFGYHIIKLEDKRKIKPESYESMKAKIRDILATKYVKEYLEKLQEQNKVEFF